MTSQPLDGGALTARTLAEAGVEVVFALHGGHLDSFFNGCVASGIRLVDCRHEAAAVNAADGYARVTGRIGVAAVTSGPGLTNALAGITNAAADNIPVLVITSSSPIREMDTLELQGGLDLIGMVSPVCKWARKVFATERIADTVGMAIRRALVDRGPTVVDVPIDVSFTPVTEDQVPRSGQPSVEAPAAASATSIERAAELLEAAERPVMIVGEGTLANDIREPLLHFAERTGVPVFKTALGSYALPRDHAQFGGGITFLPLAGEAPDLFVLAGARQGMFTGGRGGMLIPAGAKVVQLDRDAAEMGRLYPVDVSLPGEVGASLETLADARSWPERKEWCAKAVAVKGASEGMFADASVEADGLHPYRVAKELLRELPRDVDLVLDGGECAAWVDWALGATPIENILNLGYQGHLGVGQGYAIGAQVANPDRRIVQVVGDGAIAFHIQEWDTMVRHELPIVTIVFNNACWGMSIHGQEAVFGKGRDVVTKLAATRYEQVGAGFGTHAEYVEAVDEIGPAIRRALDSGRPAVVNVRTSAAVVHPVTTALLGDVNAENEIVVPYYQNLPK